MHRDMRVFVGVAAFAMLAGLPASAAIVIHATRFIYDAGEKEITAKISNTGELPTLIQAWVDAGDARATPEESDVPFNLTPPMARLDMKKSQTLRIAFTGAPLPDDRETQFWLNVLEVPPKAADGAGDHVMQMAFRYRLKLFFRPRGLPGSAAAAADALAWKVAPDGSLSVTNDTAFYVAVNDVRLRMGDASVAAEPMAVAPRTTGRVSMPKAPSGVRPVEVTYQTISDYGAFVSHTKTIDTP